MAAVFALMRDNRVVEIETDETCVDEHTMQEHAEQITVSRGLQCVALMREDHPYKNVPRVEYFLDETLNAFVSPKVHEKWILNTSRAVWEPPIPYPVGNGRHFWSDEDNAWIPE